MRDLRGCCARFGSAGETVTGGGFNFSIDPPPLDDPLKAEAKTLFVVFRETAQGPCPDAGQCARSQVRSQP